MFRLAWRRFADGHDAMVVTHAVDALAAPRPGLRWYELRRTAGGSWQVQQQGTLPARPGLPLDGLVRDGQDGGIAIGYSVSGATLTFPASASPGRTANDPAGQLSKETLVATGCGEQATASLLARWGDYSAMSVDPVDDCTLWYTTEYM